MIPENKRIQFLKNIKKGFLGRKFQITALGCLTFCLAYIIVISTIIPGIIEIGTDNKNSLDLLSAAGAFIILSMMALVLVIYMKKYNSEILIKRSKMILLYVVILLTLIIVRSVYEISPLLVPVFIAPMLISLLLDTGLAVVVNFILAAVVYYFTKSNQSILFMCLISGTLSAFIVTKAKQRNKLPISGVIVGAMNILVVTGISFIEGINLKTHLNISISVFINGIISIILTIGLLPFFESIFNIITPLKLLELENPNQPVLRRLMIEAPGTYHHSIMVSNLAEVAAEKIGADALLARVGGYYHDIGKLKRPGFFKENQMSDNPHDKMTASLSTLVITSHTHDGIVLASQYKIPQAIKDIILQHHGTTLVAYFYNKAKTKENNMNIKEEDFRYQGPKVASREAAVVMLADSVEAAVRSMPEKTKGKIEGLVRKIIRNRLDDGQLDKCSLTFKDLDNIASGFMQVFSGLFHSREEYPEIIDNFKKAETENKKIKEGKI